MKIKLIILSILFQGNLFAQNTVCLTIESNPNSNDPALAEFTKYVNVLDCFDIYAEGSISDEKVLHAAAIAAELLDNDENETVDDPLLKSQLQSNGALIPIFSQEGSNAENTFFTLYNGNGAAAVLYNNEMDPAQPGHWGSDASVEEVMHVINAVGHTNVYPSAFSIGVGSSLMTNAMDVARGGQFLTIPNPYPSEAWYHYDDQTCDYECMAIEYMYWSIVSWMGILNDPATCNGIANEWEPCSPALFQSTDVLMYNLITDPQYLLPQLAPDGNYCPNNSGTEMINEMQEIIIYPNYADHVIHVNGLRENTQLILTNATGRIVLTEETKNSAHVLNISTLNAGSYILNIRTATGQRAHKIIIR
jgi:hypothetical protein